MIISEILKGYVGISGVKMEVERIFQLQGLYNLAGQALS